jgi:hypothetical protein
MRARIIMGDSPQIAAISDHDCGRQEFSDKQGQCMMERVSPIMPESVSLFHRKANYCELHLSPKIVNIVMKQWIRL